MSFPSSQSSGGAGMTNGHGSQNELPKSRRFTDIPATIDIPVRDQVDEAVEIDLTELGDDPSDMCSLFEMEGAARIYWMTVALAYAKVKKVDFAIEMLTKGAVAMQASNPREKLSLVSCLCWMYLWKSREAPRVPAEGALLSEAKTKEHYLQLATQTLNEASKINPTFPPLFLARGVLYLLKASLQTPSKRPAAGLSSVDPEKAQTLRLAIKAFEDAMRVSQGKNMLAVLGKARAQYSLGKYPEALAGYQEVLAKMPELVDPDPRIGIGCCFWQLGFREDAKTAWERSLEINPESKMANILLGLYYLDASGNVPIYGKEFVELYKKAMTDYTQGSYKLDKNLPLTCVTFASYFLSRKQLSNADALAHKAIRFTDVNAIASDGWYLLARKEHIEGNSERAADYYRRADDARGGPERGYPPAKFGLAQLSVAKNDLAEAKLRLDKLIQQSKSHEAMTLLGTLYAEEVFASQASAVKEDKSAEAKKAISLLEAVRAAWKDVKKDLTPDTYVLLNLSRLYESEHPDKALQCLEQVEQMEIGRLPESERPKEGDEPARMEAARRLLPPQLLNNMGCFYYQAEKYERATAVFEAACDATVRLERENNDTVDIDALITTITFNTGRSYEARGLADEAIKAYEESLKRHDDYTDARTRLAYIKVRKFPNKEGPDAIATLYQEHPSDLEVRALYGWFRSHDKKKPANVTEDPEFKLYKRTLQQYDKHDRYALVGMGNMYLMAAREMRRDTDQDRAKRSGMYTRAVEFFDKALQLDPKNAYAAQGLAIALYEDKKDLKNALQILIGVRDTIKDLHVLVNLGHVYFDTRQFTRAIECYEMARARDGKANDTNILSCLGRTWLNKGRAEKDLGAYRMALEFAKKALEAAPGQVHFKFNVAFVQIQLATSIVSLNESQRTSEQLQEAVDGLEAAIKALDEIAGSDHPPYPRHDIEQRANMARNTQRRQLERALAGQREYEEKNKEKLAAAREQRQAEQRRREEERERQQAAARERQEKIRKEREEISARDQALREQRAEEERQRVEAEMTTDSETGERISKKKKKRPAAGASRSRRKKRESDEEDDGEEDGDGGGSGGGKARRPPKKRQRLTSKKESNKYKSAELVVDSDVSDGEAVNGGNDDDDDDDALERADRALERRRRSTTASSGANRGRRDDHSENEKEDRMDVDGRAGSDGAGDAGAPDDDEDDDGGAGTVSRRAQAGTRARRGRIVDESDEDEDEGAADGGAAGSASVENEKEGRDEGAFPSASASADKDRPAAEADTSMADAGDQGGDE